MFTENEKEWYFEFTPGNHSSNTTTKVYRERNGGDDIASLDDPSTYYMVDPGTTKDSCLPIPYFKPKFILVTSPDERHWVNRNLPKNVTA